MQTLTHELQKDRKKLNVLTKEFVPKLPKHGLDSKSNFYRNLIPPLTKLDSNYSFKNDFPHLKLYSDLQTIKTKFPALSRINDTHFDLSNFEDYSFCILLTSSIDDAHKSLKYGVFSGENEINESLSQLFREKHGKVLLLLGLESSSALFGVAILSSDFIFDTNFNLWLDCPRRTGFFKLKWIFVKHLDLNFNHQIENGKTLKELPSGSFLSQQNGLLLLGLFAHFRFKIDRSIFSIFPFLDQKEDGLYIAKPIVDFEIRLQKRQKTKVFGNEYLESRTISSKSDENTKSANKFKLNDGAKRCSIFPKSEIASSTYESLFSNAENASSQNHIIDNRLTNRRNSEFKETKNFKQSVNRKTVVYVRKVDQEDELTEN